MKSSARYLLAFSALYVIAYAPMLLIPSFTFDDWVWSNPALSSVAFVDIGRPYLGDLINASMRLDAHLVPFLKAGPLVAFFAFFGAWLCWFQSYKLLGVLNRSQIFWITAIGALAPLDFSRVQVNPYPLTFLAFSAAALCFIYAVARKQPLLRVPAALLLLAASLEAESVYFASAALFLAVAIIRRDEWAGEKWRLKPLMQLAARHAELFLIPVASFAIRRVWFYPAGIYQGYNAVTPGAILKSLVTAPIAALNAAYTGVASLAAFEQPQYVIAHYIFLALIAFVLVFAIVAFLKLDRSSDAQDILATRSAILVSLGVMALVLFPYAVVVGGALPVPLSNFDDRQLLFAQIPFGWAIYGIVSYVGKSDVRRGTLTVVLSILITSTMIGYWGIVRDGHLTNGLIAALKKNETARRASTVLYVPEQTPLWLGRYMRFYEWNQIMYRAYGNYTRLALPYDMLSGQHGVCPSVSELLKFRPYGGYGFQNYTGEGPVVEAQWIVPAKMTVVQLLKLSYQRAFAPALYEKSLANDDELIVVPWRNTPQTSGCLAQLKSGSHIR